MSNEGKIIVTLAPNTAVHKIKRCENIAVWLGYAVLVYAGIDAIRGLF